MMHAVALLLIAGAVATAASGSPGGPYLLGGRAQGPALDADGALAGWEGQAGLEAPATPSGAGEIRCGGNILKLAKPAAVTNEAGGLAFAYRWPEEPNLEAVVRHRWTRQGRGWTWTREVEGEIGEAAFQGSLGK
jgi:hypothetical protein